ncbi:hypothetical protein NL108_016137 [Boleophthalmus pectinirostris]|uniref:G2 and S phase-expressed protein 1 n=1 Tax=Boleophthalmus pectinirostris TaxID=150288 RepID=UPI000A1C6CB7|nr:G2 and S phase-expressed protein 1 [Boleophthalmus pectinirostris]XP_055011711.1 G2 and S phase-expressed protein 1 [Boleophthalmus pectinirostris]KAJ0069911.1 hypothetical protein NL108_016137 [Boleophthalmus pectinirostris]
MDHGANNDVFFLPDEKFDFDLSLSPASSTGEDFEDEIFVGPVSHAERCISVNLASRLENHCVKSSWSPLSGDQLEAICEEAQKLADQLQSSEHAQSESENIDPNRAVLQKNEFVQDSKAKLSMLCDPPPTVLSPIKRQTFCVQDSPMKHLPPAIQNRMLKARSPKSSIGNIPSIKPTGKAQLTQHLPSRATRSVASPVTRTQTKAGLQARVSAVLPNRPTVPTATRSSTKSQDKPRLQPPTKLATSWRRSPNSSRNGSCEDLLSDSASVTSDISDSSLNSSCLGKRTLAPPSKTLRTRSGVKLPSDSSRLRNTSSSSSSVSSFNSSISLSPANKATKGKLNSSLSSQCSVSKPTQPPKHRRSVAVLPSDPPISVARKRSLSTQTRRSSNPTLLKKPQSSPVQTPVRRGLDRTSSVPSMTKIQSGLKAKAKPQALVPPTPNGTLRGSSSPDTTNMLKPKRLVSVKSVDSLPQKPALSTLTPSLGNGSALQLKARRPSALPTPVRSRLLGLPQTTPTSKVRPIRVSPTHNCTPTSSHTECPETAQVPVIQPFNLEEEEPVQPPPTITKPDQSESTTAPDALCLSQCETRKETAPAKTESTSKTQEILLLDLPAPALQPQEKLLIDLSNTPDLIRTKTCSSASELIDLSSPLIKWSPVNKKEKDAPLINLSF